MAEDFYPFVDSGDEAPDNSHLDPNKALKQATSITNGEDRGCGVVYATRIAVYDDMLSAPRVIVVEQADIRTYLEEITNTVYRCMKEQGGHLALQVIREIVENFIHARFIEPIISILDGGNTIRFADQGPGIEDKERAFEFGVTSADREQKRYIRGTGSGFPIVSDYLENAGGAISIEDNIGQGTVVTVSVDAQRVAQITQSVSRGAAVRGRKNPVVTDSVPVAAPAAQPMMTGPQQVGGYPTQQAYAAYPQQGGYPSAMPAPMGYPPYTAPAGMMMPAATVPQAGYFSAAVQPPQMQPATQTAPAPAPSSPYVSERGMLALQYLVEHGSCGPTDLSAAYGDSTPTWSRELATLATTGFVVKQGQKRILTDMGRAWIQQQG